MWEVSFTFIWTSFDFVPKELWENNKSYLVDVCNLITDGVTFCL